MVDEVMPVTGLIVDEDGDKSDSVASPAPERVV